MRDALSRAALGIARRLWKASPRPVRDAFGLAVGARLRDRLAAGVRAQPWAPGAASPIVVSAFFGGATGVAAAGRATATLLERAGFEVIRHDLATLLDAGGFQAHDLPGDPNGVWLIHANPPEAKLALARLHRRVWEQRYRIGYWAWELPRAPADWIDTAASFHEVWAPSTFVRDSLAGAPTRLVLRHHAPPDVEGATADRARFGVEDDAVVFLCMADLSSGLRRKNLLGAVEAFRRTYPEPQPGVVLVVKIHSADADVTALAALERAAHGRPDIRIVDGRLSHSDALRLIASCDVLLSLHRSEGFGLPIAEALALGKAVLATGWSGSEDFLSGVEEARLPYALVPVSDPGGPYDDPSQVWAEPDLDAAASRIRALPADPETRARIAAQGAVAVSELARAWGPELLRAEPWAPAISRRG